MRVLREVVYAVMALWLLVASGRRIALLLLDGQPVDWSPPVSGAIGVLALLLLLPAIDDWEQRRGDRG